MAGTYLSMFGMKSKIFVFFYILMRFLIYILLLLLLLFWDIISLNKLKKYTITVIEKGYVSWPTYNFPYKT